LDQTHHIELDFAHQGSWVGADELTMHPGTGIVDQSVVADPLCQRRSRTGLGQVVAVEDCPDAAPKLVGQPVESVGARRATKIRFAPRAAS
jgi:hypothetical protein